MTILDKSYKSKSSSVFRVNPVFQFLFLPIMYPITAPKPHDGNIRQSEGIPLNINKELPMNHIKIPIVNPPKSTIYNIFVIIFWYLDFISKTTIKATTVRIVDIIAMAKIKIPMKNNIQATKFQPAIKPLKK
ncbi:MAG: hypothetical protein P8Y70_07905 [Candidatus Lokiarchaeota archaeon]